MKDYDLFPETQKKDLLKKINNSTPKFEDLLAKSYNYFQLVDKKILKVNTFENEVKKIFEFTVFLCISWLDISAATSVYLKSHEKYERLFSIRNLTIYLNEGYKRMHHFTESKRKESLWIQNISAIIENEKFHKFKSRFDEINQHLINYEVQFQNEKLKYERNIFVHYQGSPIKVYETFNEIDILTLLNNTTKYLNISTEIINFTTEIINELEKNYYG